MSVGVRWWVRWGWYGGSGGKVVLVVVFVVVWMGESLYWEPVWFV